MIKKIAVATAAAAVTLLALSPLALAAPDESPRPASVTDDHDHDHQYGLVNVGDVLNGVNVCPDVGAGVGILGILGQGRDSGDVTACAADDDD